MSPRLRPLSSPPVGIWVAICKHFEYFRDPMEEGSGRSGRLSDAAHGRDRALTSALAEGLFTALSPSRSLYLGASAHPMFEGFGLLRGVETGRAVPPDYALHDGGQQSESEDAHYDLVVADLSFEAHKMDERAIHAWVGAGGWLAALSGSGYALFPWPQPFSWERGRRFLTSLSDHGYHVTAAFEPPEGVLRPISVIRPDLLLVSRRQSESLFIAEITTQERIDQIVSHFVAGTNSTELASGCLVKLDSFRGFTRLRASREIESLETQYKDFDTARISNVSTDIRTARPDESFQPAKNTIYFPRIGTAPVVSSLESTTLKHQNYFQIPLKEELLRAEYAELFLASTLGHLVRSSVVSGGVIPKITKSDVRDVAIPVPSLAEQDTLISTRRNLRRLANEIVELERELALNPRNVREIQEQVDPILDGLGALTDADRIRACIRAGESKKVEFKQTLSLNIHTKKKDERLQTSALKTVVAFLNTEGGTLLIGVTDDGDVVGLDEDIRSVGGTKDRYLLHFKNLLAGRIGKQFYQFVEYWFVSIGDNTTLLVDCAESTQPCYLDNKDFYVRGNPASDKLEGRELLDYVRNRFPS